MLKTIVKPENSISKKLKNDNSEDDKFSIGDDSKKLIKKSGKLKS